MSDGKEFGGTLGQGIGQGIGEKFGGPAGGQVLGQAGKELGEGIGTVWDDWVPPDMGEPSGDGADYTPDPGVADVSDSADGMNSTPADRGISSGPDQNYTPAE